MALTLIKSGIIFFKQFNLKISKRVLHERLGIEMLGNFGPTRLVFQLL